MEITSIYYNHSNNTLHIEGNYSSTGSTEYPEVYVTTNNYFNKLWTPDPSELDEEAELDCANKGIYAHLRASGETSIINVTTVNNVRHATIDIPLTTMNAFLGSGKEFKPSDLFIVYFKFNASVRTHIYAWSSIGTTPSRVYTSADNPTTQHKAVDANDAEYDITARSQSPNNTITINVTAGQIAYSVTLTRDADNDRQSVCDCGSCYVTGITYDKYIVARNLLEQSKCHVVNRDNRCSISNSFIEKVLTNDTLILATKFNDIKYAIRCYEILGINSNSVNTNTCNCNAR